MGVRDINAFGGMGLLLITSNSDPHVGLEVCMSAFDKVPLDMRRRMAEFTSGTTRLVGGSADTLYIPGRHREKFMDTLGLFLETDCFLEIATPTTVHLVVPRDEPILYVDHVSYHGFSY